MNADEAAELLAHCSGFDNRQPSVAAAKSWAAALHDIPLDRDTRNAVATYYTTPPQNPNERLWILPHHVRTLRAKIRSARLENFQYEPVGDETVPQYLTRLRGQTQAIASGQAPPPTGRLALTGSPPREFVQELEARGWEGNRTVDAELTDTVRRAGPLGIECPACHAAIGRPCKTPGGSDKHPLGKPRRTPHGARQRATNGIPELTAAQRAAEEQAIKARAARHLARQDDDIPDAEIVDEAS
ncbi:hypothetical protein ACFXKY_07785 [Streptomyces canus]|uniref:zinc finger domain-containing protein n=1 Tax=Streptomyces canus TaxID=58343 RepID=UPI0036A81BCB